MHGVRAQRATLGNAGDRVLKLADLNLVPVGDLVASERRSIAGGAGPRIWRASTWFPAMSPCWSAKPRMRFAPRRARPGYADRTVFFIDRSFAWDELRHASQSLSLFAERRLFELRMPSGKPDKGAALLAELAARPPPDVVCLVVTDKLDERRAMPPGYRPIERHGVWVPIWPVTDGGAAGLAARARQTAEGRHRTRPRRS